MSKPQLFCFTYAGGNASFFDAIEKDISDFDVVKLEYAGHATRHKEPLYQNFGELAEDMLKMLKIRYHGGSYALFGYSMGTIRLVEVLKWIMRDVFFPSRNTLFWQPMNRLPKQSLQDILQMS